MIQISPFEVIISEQEYIQGVGLEYAIVNVLGIDGVSYRLQKLSGNRKILNQIGDSGINSGKSSLQESLSILPKDKKIPIQLLEDIILFFRKVMNLKGNNSSKHGEYEAMAHILWNRDTEEYRVAIPKQKVSKASVSYDWSHKGDNEEVILDIHSHNTMGAFFSGTDDSDDKTYFGISGVAGKLNDPNPALIWRVNFALTKKEISIADIFEDKVKEDNPDVENWLSQVEISSYSSGLSKVGTIYGGAPWSQGGLGWGKDFSGEEVDLLEGNPRSQAGDSPFLLDPLEESVEVTGLANNAIEKLDDDDRCQLICLLAETVDYKILNAYGIDILSE